jgi:hypothetical protein
MTQSLLASSFRWANISIDITLSIKFRYEKNINANKNKNIRFSSLLFNTYVIKVSGDNVC